MRTISVLLLIVLLSSCRLFGGKRVAGNGNVITKQINTGSFQNVDASGAVTVYLQQGATAGASVETDENLLEYVEVVTEGGTLHIRSKNGFDLRPSKELVIRVTAPQLENIEISGASKLIGQGLVKGDELQVNGSGASEIQLDVELSKFQSDLSGNCTLRMKGKVDDFSVEASGASNIQCLELITEKADFDLSGASDAKVTVNKELVVDASGASNVEYKGNANVNQKSSGASSVKKI